MSDSFKVADHARLRVGLSHNPGPSTRHVETPVPQQRSDRPCRSNVVQCKVPHSSALPIVSDRDLAGTIWTHHGQQVQIFHLDLNFQVRLNDHDPIRLGDRSTL